MIDSFVILGIILGGIITLSLKIVLNSGAYADRTHKSTLKLYKDYIKELEISLEDYKKEAISAKRRYANREAAPQISGDLSDIGSLLPSILPSITAKLPKWLQPLAQNPQVIESITRYASEHPDKVQSLLGSVLNSKSKDVTNVTNTSNKDEGISI